MIDKLVFGYLADASSAAIRTQMAELAQLLGKIAGVEISLCESSSYGDLASAMNGGKINLAWLPPIPFVALERRGAAVALVSHQRNGASPYQSVLIVRTSSKTRSLSSLRGQRAAWVDPQSAAGYVLPRIGLAALGVDPRTSFSGEKFWHAHHAVVNAVRDGSADFGATYAGFDAHGVAVRGPWMDSPTEVATLRVLASFGEIPGDVIAARVKLGGALRDQVTRALLALSRDRGNQPLLRAAFGADELREFSPSGYDVLTRAVTDASSQGLLEGLERG